MSDEKQRTSRAMKKRVRERMARTGETYQQALVALRQEAVIARQAEG